jgi:hypothetical protein
MGAATAQQQPAVPATDVQVGFERRPQLSFKEQLTQAEVLLARIDSETGALHRQLESARTERDVIKTLCLNDKLSQMDVTARSARDRQAALQAAVQRSDAELANHEFTVLTVMGQRVQQLTAEANQCIGEELAFLGQTQTITSVDPNLPGENTTAYPPSDPTLITGPPVCSTCTGM